MRPSPSVVIAAGVTYAVLNVLWLLAGNAGNFAGTQRTLLKDATLVAAILVYVGTVLVSAWHGTKQPVASAALNSGGGVALGVLLIVLTGFVWPKARLFHDSTAAEQIARLLGFVILLTLASAVAGAALGLAVSRARKLVAA
jgi:hypothetical protein